ncbi:MAG: Hsp33 family molecular chaperone HslO [Hylemonella sp.]
MSELHKFIFEGLPVRGLLVRLTDAWTEILARRTAQPYAQPVQHLLGEMLAAGVLMQSNIKFDGALILQVFGDGPVKVAVVEVQSDLSLRASATIRGEVSEQALLGDLVNLHGMGRCAITLDPKSRLPGQQPYQGVVSLVDGEQRKLESMAQALQHYMRQSEQLETTLVLAADDQVAAGLLIQRMPTLGNRNLQTQSAEELDEHYQRIAILAASLRREELLTLDVETVLRRLFWQEKLQRLESLQGDRGPRFACTCSRQRVANMIRGLGAQEAQDILAERGSIEVSCEFCGAHYRFDRVDVGQLFTTVEDLPPSSDAVQ